MNDNIYEILCKNTTYNEKLGPIYTLKFSKTKFQDCIIFSIITSENSIVLAKNCTIKNNIIAFDNSKIILEDCILYSNISSFLNSNIEVNNIKSNINEINTHNNSKIKIQNCVINRLESSHYSKIELEHCIIKQAAVAHDNSEINGKNIEYIAKNKYACDNSKIKFTLS